MFDKKYLFILPFDHRSFFSRFLEFDKKLLKNKNKIIKEIKEIIYQGFLLAHKKSKYRNYMGILIDENFGSDIIKDAKKKKIILSVSVEKSGQDCFSFEYGKDFRNHVTKFNPDFAKILIKYDSRGDNKLQLKRMKLFSDFCHDKKIDFLLELLTPVEKNKVDLTQKAISEILLYGINPKIWKIEGYEKKSDWKIIIQTVSSFQKNSKIIMLGRGESDKLVEKWIRAAKGSDKIIGFAVGRTVFLKAISDYYKKKISKQEAIENISQNYLKLVNLWIKL